MTATDAETVAKTMIDLSEGAPPRGGNCGTDTGGIVTQRCGHTFYSLRVGPDDDGDYEYRIENGVYRGVTLDGFVCHIAIVDGRQRWVRYVNDTSESPLDIVAFIRCPWDDPRARGLPSEGRL